MVTGTQADSVRQLDEESLRIFAEKGREGGAEIPQQGDANAVKVRRVIQITHDLASRPFDQLRILDVACGEGVYSIEAGLRGAQVIGVDARTERMSHGIACAKKNELPNVQFQQVDIRSVSNETHGEFDVIFFLGILYHLDVPDLFHILKSMHGMCREFIVIDTHVARFVETVEYGSQVYRGTKGREHQDSDLPDARRSRLLMSIDNTYNFQFTAESLVRLLNDVGFTSVFECLAPLEPFKPSHRRTFVAHKGQRVKISTYPWLNDLVESDIQRRLQPTSPRPKKLKQRATALVKKLIDRLGYEIRLK